MLSQNLTQGIRPVLRTRSGSFSQTSQVSIPTIHHRHASFAGRRSSLSRLLNDNPNASLEPFDISSRERRFLRRMAMLDRALKEDPFRTLFGSSVSMLHGK